MGDAFERGTAACNEAGLPHHPGKRVRAATDGVALGAELVDGRFLGTERARRMLLSVLSLGIARGGMVTGALMRKVLASWTYSMLYRRPTMCILGSSFNELPSVDRDREVYRLPPGSQDDLALAACFAPLMFTHLQARHSHELICTDASDHYIAAVSAKAPEALCKELWRLRERKGWSAHLVGRATEYVMSCGDERAVADINEALVELWTAPPKGGHNSVPRSLVERFDYLELCCGKGSPMIKAGEAAGLRCGPRIDLLLHKVWDIRSSRRISWVLFLVHNGRVFWVHCGAPCTTFSIARCPKLRSILFPWGFDIRNPHTLVGNILLCRTLIVLNAIRLAGKYQLVPTVRGSHEHPATAYSWHCKEVKLLFSHDRCGTVDVSYCHFGAPYRKTLVWDLFLLKDYLLSRGGYAEGVMLISDWRGRSLLRLQPTRLDYVKNGLTLFA